jgi:predicted dehydrogenase
MPAPGVAARVGVAGTGRAFERLYAPALARIRELVVVATADPHPGAGGTAPHFPSVDAMLAQVRLDGLLVLSPPHLHGEHVGAGLAAGLHVLVEKPPAASAGELDRWPAEARERFGAAFTRRGWPGYRRLRGSPGQSWSLVIETNPLAWGAREPAALELDLLPHAIDLAEWLSGASIVQVDVETRTPALLAGVFWLDNGVRFGWRVSHANRYREALWLDGRLVLGRPQRWQIPAVGRGPEAVDGAARVLRAWAAAMGSGTADSAELVADFAAARRHMAVLERVIKGGRA